MKKLIFIFFLICSISVSATNYYVSSSDGSDGDSGLSEALAWQTLTKVNAATFAPGDIVYFKRDDKWYGQLVAYSGSAVNVVTYSAYGIGANPEFNYALDCSSSVNWTQESTNKWKYSSTQAYDAGNVIFNNSSLVGVKKWNKYALNAQGNYYWDKVTNYLYIYSTSNPGTYYSKIESLMNNTIINFSNKNYITFENLTVTKGGRLGFNGTASTNITIRNCDVSWIGAGCQLAADSIRVGNGIQFYSAASDILVENCRIWECYDTGITHQSYDDYTTFSNITYRNNLIWNCEYSIEIYSRGENSIVENILVENNTCVNAGSSWAHSQRPVPNAYHLRLALTPVSTTNFVVKNNIFDTSTEHIIGIIYNDAARYLSDYNICYQPSGSFGFRYGTTFTTIETFRAATGFEVHSINQSPLFKDKAGLDFRIITTSPAIDFGNPSGDAGKLNWRYIPTNPTGSNKQIKSSTGKPLKSSSGFPIY